jgi:protein involved in polysaccharide export with SLBB domain
MSRRSFARIAAVFAASALLITFATFASGPQHQATLPAPRSKKEGPLPPPPVAKDLDPHHGPGPKHRATAEVDRSINAFDLKQHPLASIPDDPPPHEGALIDISYIVEPPDMLLVEVLEALPGRPISGERLVQPDGTIDLGFYGHVYVRGLTIPQVKVAVIKHLRKYLDDETLGLLTEVGDDEEPAPARRESKPLPPLGLPDAKLNPLDDLDGAKTAPPQAKPRAGLGPRKRRGALLRSASHTIAIRPVGSTSRSQEPGEKEEAEKDPKPIRVPLPGSGQLRITIEVQGQSAVREVPNPPGKADIPPAEAGIEEAWIPLAPLDNDRVFVGLTAFNSKNYYVLGDVLVPGKLPHTGNETVLDALQYAGGLLPTAEPKDIRLVRPGRNGKPSKVYRVDLEAIQEKGDVRTNYQIFPGDRLIFGRNEVVKKTVEIDRLHAPIQAIVTSIRQNADMLKALGALSPERSDEVLKDLVDFWAKEVSRQGDLKFDEATLREVLMRQLKKAPAAPRRGLEPGSK